MYQHILIATDGSELAGRAVTTGLALAKLLKARVTAVTVTELWSAMVIGEPALVFPIEEYEKAAAQNAALHPLRCEQLGRGRRCQMRNGARQ